MSPRAVGAPPARPSLGFDVVFTDTCLGGSTVAAQVGASAVGLRGYFLADYAVNPLGVKTPAAVREALEQWIRVGMARASTLVVACNTASVLLEQLPDVATRAADAGLRVLSMVGLLDRVLASAAAAIQGRRVCLMGTRFTVSQPVYRQRLIRAGAAEVLPLAATRTEHAIAHLRHLTVEGRREIADEVGETVRHADVVVLACTLFPLVGRLLHDINPDCLLVDPAAGVDGLLTGAAAGGANRMTIALTGDTIPLDDVRAQSGVLFAGWAIESVGTATIEQAPAIRALPGRPTTTRGKPF